MKTINDAKQVIGGPVQDAITLVQNYPKFAFTVDCVIFGFDESQLKVLLIRSDLEMYQGKWSLPGDIVREDEQLSEAAYRVMNERTGMYDGYLEQVRCFSHPDRHPGGRVLTVAYCSLLDVKHHQLKITPNELHWHNLKSIADDQMAFDHNAIIGYCYRWLQKRIQEHPLGFNLLPEKFSLRALQLLYESILNVQLDRRNFRKKFFAMDVLEDTGEYESDVKHRPGKLYRFDHGKYEQSKRLWVGIDF